MTHIQRKARACSLTKPSLFTSSSKQRTGNSFLKEDLSIKHNDDKSGPRALWGFAYQKPIYCRNIYFVSNINDILRTLCLLFNIAIIYWWLMANKQSPLPLLWLLVSIYGLGPLASLWKPLRQGSWYSAEDDMQKCYRPTQ